MPQKPKKGPFVTMVRRIIPARLRSHHSSHSHGHNQHHHPKENRCSNRPMRNKTDSASPVRDQGNGLALKVVIMKVRRPRVCLGLSQRVSCSRDH